MKNIILFLLAIWLPNFAFAQSASILYDEGLALKKSGKTREALSKFNQALTLNPLYTDALYETGWCQTELKEYNSALAIFKKVRDKWPQIAKVHFETGYAFQQLKQKDSALASYNNCLKINPEYSLVFKQLGTMYYHEDDHQKALINMNKYIELSKNEIRDYLFWYRKGYSENNIKEYEKAILSLDKSLQYKVDYENTFLELGYANFKLKFNDEAIRCYKKATELAPKNHVGYNGIAEVYRDNIKDMNEAMNWYKKTLAINATERKANYGMGYCLNSQKKYDEAIPYIKQAIQSEPTYSAAYTELGYSYFKNNNNNLAIENLKKAIQLNPKGQNQLYYATLVYLSMNDKSNAQKMVNELKLLESKFVPELQEKINKMP